MSEEDTFRLLSRVDITTMHQIWEKSPYPVPKWHDSIPDDVRELFSRHGWEYKEWVKAFHAERVRKWRIEHD